MALRCRADGGHSCWWYSVPKLFAVAVLLAGSAPAAGKTLYDGTHISVVASNPVPVGQSLLGFTLSAIGSGGAIPNTFDSTNSGQGGTGIGTVGENLAQVWEFNAVQTPTSNLNVPGDIPQDIDTHFLVDSNAIFSVVPPKENRVVPNTIENPYAGFGDALWGSFAVLSQSSSTWDFAYVVVPLDTTVLLNFQLAAPSFPAEPVAASWTLAFPTGDVNMDGSVNGLDISVVASTWLTNSRYGDANDDGVVNGLDISVIASNWLDVDDPTLPAPEPGGVTLGGLALALLYSTRRYHVGR